MHLREQYKIKNKGNSWPLYIDQNDSKDSCNVPNIAQINAVVYTQRLFIKKAWEKRTTPIPLSRFIKQHNHLSTKSAY